MADVEKIKSLLDQAEVSLQQRPNRPPPDVVTAVATLIAAIRELVAKPAPKAEPPADISGDITKIDKPKPAAPKAKARKASR